MATEVDFLLIGGGLVSATAAKTLREQGAEGAVVILAAEPLLPYHRPPLTRSFLLGKRPHASLLVLNEAYFRDHGVQVLLGTRALAVEPQKRRVRTDSAGGFTYRKLLIATGGSPRRFKVPGAELCQPLSEQETSTPGPHVAVKKKAKKDEQTSRRPKRHDREEM